MPKLKGVFFETVIIERYCHRESSAEEELIEIYLDGVPMRQVKDISEALCGSWASVYTVSDPNQKAYVHIEEWRNRKLSGNYPLYINGIYLKCNVDGKFENVGILVAIDVDEDRYREVILLPKDQKKAKGVTEKLFYLRLNGAVKGQNAALKKH